MNKKDTWIIIASISGAISVIAGAFGAHLLESQLSANYLSTFNTGARYHQIHSVLLLVVAIQLSKGGVANKLATRFLLAGIILFSGSLYALSVSTIFTNSLSWLGAITPIGGLSLILGWLFIARAAIKKG
jgi:uncharacterized membrane protein YgdD (TMEM256/DUF423 family)